MNKSITCGKKVKLCIFTILIKTWFKFKTRFKKNFKNAVKKFVNFELSLFY